MASNFDLSALQLQDQINFFENYYVDSMVDHADRNTLSSILEIINNLKGELLHSGDFNQSA